MGWLQAAARDPCPQLCAAAIALRAPGNARLLRRLRLLWRPRFRGDSHDHNRRSTLVLRLIGSEVHFRSVASPDATRVEQVLKPRLEVHPGRRGTRRRQEVHRVFRKAFAPPLLRLSIWTPLSASEFLKQTELKRGWSRFIVGYRDPSPYRACPQEQYQERRCPLTGE